MLERQYACTQPHACAFVCTCVYRGNYAVHALNVYGKPQTVWHVIFFGPGVHATAAEKEHPELLVENGSFNTKTEVHPEPDAATTNTPVQPLALPSKAKLPKDGSEHGGVVGGAKASVSELRASLAETAAVVAALAAKMQALSEKIDALDTIPAGL